MKKLIVLILWGIIFSVGVCAKGDNNIISIVGGVGPVGTQSTVGTISSTTTVTPGHDHHNTTTNISSNSYFMPQNGGVIGLQYQHKVEGSPLWVGTLIQSNGTYSVSCGIGF